MLSVVTNLGPKANLNSIDALGVYQAIDVVNGPVGVSGYVFVLVTSANVGGNSRAVQKIWNLDSGTEYTRVKTIGGWTPWETGGGGGGGGDYDPLGTADAVMADHVAEADPHPQYLTEAEATALYDATGAADAAVAAHVSAVDPHTQYLTNARGDARYDAINAADDAVAAHVAAVDPHTQYLTNARGDARYDEIGAADAAVAAHEAESDPHSQYLNEARGDARYDASGTAASAASAAVAAHVADSDPHTQYLTNARGDARYDAINAADDAVTTHVAEADPHTQYLNNTRGDARYDATGTADAAVAAHEGEADPHTQYFNTTRGDARYALISHTQAISTITGLQTALDGKQAALGYTPANKAGDTFTGNIGITAAATANRVVWFYTSMSARWAFFANSASESGSNAGSNLEIQSYNDSGAYITSPLIINRATGVMTLSATPTVAGSTVWHAGNDGNGSGLDADKWKGATFTVSTSAPSGGADGDFWFQREA